MAKSAEFPKKTDSTPAVSAPKSSASISHTKRSSFDTDVKASGSKQAPVTSPKKFPISPVNTHPKSTAPAPKQHSPAGTTKEPLERKIRRTQSIGANDSKAMIQRPNLTPVKPTTDANGKLSAIPEIPASNPKLVVPAKKAPTPPRPKLNRQLSSTGIPKPLQYNTYPHPSMNSTSAN